MEETGAEKGLCTKLQTCSGVGGADWSHGALEDKATGSKSISVIIWVELPVQTAAAGPCTC